MSYKIGVFGSANKAAHGDDINQLAAIIGQTLGKNKATVLTGACTGLPYTAASEASKLGSPVWGYSPVADLQSQRKHTPDDDLSIYTKIVYVPKDFSFSNNLRVCMKYRNVLTTATCDGGIVISGRWGSLNEFTNLIDMQKIVAVLTGSGGIADELVELNNRIHKEGQGELIFDNNPERLVEKLLARLDETTK